ncbi:MAG: preprotein translocase subunit SecE [Candidatus Pacebacteria bacterium]|nr:preprotein translocase subunit SecE [Candidatus Paceibacterota bacterium]
MAMGDKIKLFFKEVWTESRKVDWPSRQQTLRYTALVLGISAGVAVFLGALDFVFVSVLSKFII